MAEEHYRKLAAFMNMLAKPGVFEAANAFVVELIKYREREDSTVPSKRFRHADVDQTTIDIDYLPHYPQAQGLSYQTAGASGVDLRAAIKDPLVIGANGQSFLVPTGIVLRIPAGVEGQIRSRSGLACGNRIAVINSPGTIDSDYRGELHVCLINLSNEAFTIRPADRIAQLVFAPVIQVAFQRQTIRADETKRGAGGFGSTGVSSLPERTNAQS